MNDCKYTLIKGDAVKQSGDDILAEFVTLDLGKKPRGYDGRNCGWRVLNVYGPENMQQVEWARVVMRHELPFSLTPPD